MDNTASSPSIVCSWSGGEDSMVLLETLRQSPGTVNGLLTNLNRNRDRVSMHGVRRSLIERQADALGCSVRFAGIPENATNEVYRERMLETFEILADAGVEAVAFGDIHLEGVRSFREQLFEKSELEPVFPLWGMAPSEVAETFIQRGYRAIIVCRDPDTVDRDCLGDDYAVFLEDGLDGGVDPCGENGEFHTFVYDGPALDQEVSFDAGDTVDKHGFRFLDLKPLVSDEDG